MKARGNEGVAGLIKRSPATIGYVEYGIAQRAQLTMAMLENKAGNFIPADGDTGFATLVEAPLPDNLRAFFPDPEGEKSYPIVTYTWLMVYQRYEDAEKADELKRFLRWCLTDGQQFNEPLGYIRLAPRVADRAIDAVNAIQ
jgi:phosphate transport system substrate-binding protein